MVIAAVGCFIPKKRQRKSKVEGMDFASIRVGHWRP